MEPSYAAATQLGIDSLHREVIARAGAKARQVVIKCDSPTTLALSDKEFITKVNFALQPKDPGDPRPMDMLCLSIRHSCHNIIILELNNPAGAQWFQSPYHKMEFLRGFNMSANLLEPMFRALATFVSISPDINSPSTVSSIEQLSLLLPHSIHKIKWIKKPLLRTREQWVTHTIFYFHEALEANQAICSGLVIEGKKVSAHCCTQTCCFHCNKIRVHFAKACPHKKGLCGTHGGDEKLRAHDKQANFKYYLLPENSTTWITANPT